MIDTTILRAFLEAEISVHQEMFDRLGENDRLNAGIMHAWGIIANASGGDWTKEDTGWQAAAASFRDTYVTTSQQSPAAGFRWVRIEEYEELEKARQILKALGVCKHGNALYEADCGCGT